MAFYGCQFVFDGIPSWEYGLMVYDVSSHNEDGKFSSAPTKIYEDRSAWRYKPIHYGVSRNTPLSFKLTFGVLPENNKPWIDRLEMDVVATWLTGKDGYCYLEIMQPDMEAVRYNCIISDLQYTTYGKLPWAFTCEVMCDSPYAYLYPETITHNVTGSLDVVFDNRASAKLYRPTMEITLYSGSAFSIVNHSDGDRTFAFSNVGAVPLVIMVDNENEIITNNRDLNLYDKFNFKFFRLVRGRNNLTLTADNATVKYFTEFPINVGG